MLLEVKGLEVHYGGIRAVKGIDLEVGAGELVTLIGANGAGKTTTLKAICRLIPSAAKTLSYQGNDISRAAVHELPRQGLRQQHRRAQVDGMGSVSAATDCSRRVRPEAGIVMRMSTSHSSRSARRSQ